MHTNLIKRTSGKQRPAADFYSAAGLMAIRWGKKMSPCGGITRARLLQESKEYLHFYLQLAANEMTPCTHSSMPSSSLKLRLSLVCCGLPALSINTSLERSALLTCTQVQARPHTHTHTPSGKKLFYYLQIIKKNVSQKKIKSPSSALNFNPNALSGFCSIGWFAEFLSLLFLPSAPIFVVFVSVIYGN